MDTSFFELESDLVMAKQAGYIDGDPENLGQVAAQSALYLAPVTGTLMTFKDAYNNFRDGKIWSGIGNTLLGTASGVADFFTLGAGGTALRAAMKGKKLYDLGRAGRSAYRAARAAQAARLAQTGKYGKHLNTAVNFANAGKALNPAITYGANAAGNAIEDSQARKIVAQQQYNQQSAWQPQQQFQFGAYQQPAAPATVPSAKPRYGYNPNTYRYERLY